jgi:hypothetical protein
MFWKSRGVLADIRFGVEARWQTMWPVMFANSQLRVWKPEA